MQEMKAVSDVTENENGQIIKAASTFFDNNTKAGLILLSGISIGALAYKTYKSLPGPHESIPTELDNLHPLLGHVPFFKKNYSTLHDSLFNVLKNEEIMAMKLPGFYQIFLMKPELIEWVFTTKFDSFFKGSSQNEKISDLFGKYGQGIFVSDGHKWRFHRKIGSRMFSVRNLRDYMFGCCTNTTSSTMNVLEKLRSTEQIIDINDILGRMTFDCFTSIAFGKSFDSMSLYPASHPFGVSFDALIELLPKRNQEPFWKLKRYFKTDYEAEISQHMKVINEFTHKLITEKKNAAIQNITDESGKNTFDLFTLYNQHKKDLKINDMKSIALNFIIAGRDTTRMLTSWFLYDLTVYPDIKKNVVAEIDEFNKNKDKALDYKTITRQFKYLEAVLCETLRYHPVVPFSTREAKQDIEIPQNICKTKDGKNYLIKKGDRLQIHHFTICKLESFYKNPMKYDPMRFYEKGVKTFKQSTYPFFNQFPRLCLGREFALMEAKIFIYHFLTSYDFELVKDQQVTYSPGFIFNMKNGLKINIKKRN